MRVILFTESQELIRTIDDICISKDSFFKLVSISYDHIKMLTLTSKVDVYIIDDAYFNTLDKSYLTLLKALKVDVIILVTELAELDKYTEYNVIEYMFGSFKPLRLRLCLDRLYKRNIIMDKTRFNKLNDKILIRNRCDVTIVEIKEISYLKVLPDYIQVFIGRDILISTDSLIYFESMISEAFFRIADDIIVNFEKVHEITKVKDDTYNLKLIDCESDLVMGDYLMGYDIEDDIQNKRKEYLVKTIKNEIN